jgi:hypothetical protein
VCLYPHGEGWVYAYILTARVGCMLISSWRGLGVCLYPHGEGSVYAYILTADFDETQCAHPWQNIEYFFIPWTLQGPFKP